MMNGSIRSFLLVALLCAFLPGLSSCTPAEPPERTPPGETTRPADSPDATETAQPVPLDRLGIRLETVAAGVEEPLFVTHAGDGSGRLFVVEKGGRIRVVRDGRLEDEPFLDVADQVSSGGEQGLLGLAFAPDYEESGEFYVNLTDRSGDTVIARYVAQDPASDAPTMSDPDVMLQVDQPYANHNGGCIQFAPDGTLWVGMGDGGAAGDPQNRAQDADSMLGKMLSLDVEGDGGRPEPRVVASGLRNPWRFSFDRQTDDLWIGDVGQREREEIDFVTFSEARGANFGWNLWEGTQPYPPGANRDRGGFVFPVVDYGRDEGGSVTGGYVYRGSAYPELDGVYFYADYLGGWIAGARRDESGKVETRTLLPDAGITPASFGEDEAGELYVCDLNGEVLRIVAE